MVGGSSLGNDFTFLDTYGGVCLLCDAYSVSEHGQLVVCTVVRFRGIVASVSFAYVGVYVGVDVDP